MKFPYHHICWGLDGTSYDGLSQSSAAASCRLFVRFLCLSSLSNFNAPWWQVMMMEMLSEPERIGWQYPVVYTVTKHSHSQVGSWTNTLSLLPWVMSMLLKIFEWWWQWNCHNNTFAKDQMAHLLTCHHKVQPQQAVLLGEFFCLSSSSNVNAPWWQVMTMELLTQPARIGQQ